MLESLVCNKDKVNEGVAEGAVPKSVGTAACSDLYLQIPLNPLSLGLVFPVTSQPPSISGWTGG